jgi:hypothetical protein
MNLHLHKMQKWIPIFKLVHQFLLTHAPSCHKLLTVPGTSSWLLLKYAEHQSIPEQSAHKEQHCCISHCSRSPIVTFAPLGVCHFAMTVS